MSQVIKTFLGIFLIMMMTVLSLGILNSFMEVGNAQTMHSVFITELEDSHFNREVIENCFQRAEQAGYELTVTAYSENGSKVTLENRSQAAGSQNEIRLAVVVLNYTVSLPMMESGFSKQVIGIAR